MRIFGISDTGRKRSVNQDSFKIKEYSDCVLAVVCDGMGGALGGSEASSLAASAFVLCADGIMEKLKDAGEITEKKARRLLFSATDAANDAVFSRSSEDEGLRGMGTTLVAALFAGGAVYIVNVGDSRMYICCDKEIRQITHDHSYVQYLVDLGKITPEEARRSINRNIITRAVGTEESVDADFFTVSDTEYKSSKRTFALLSTDGLTNHLSDDDIKKILSSLAPSDELSSAAGKLVAAANENGGSDNITVVIAEL